MNGSKLFEHSDFHFGKKYKPFLKPTELKKKVVEKVTFLFGLELLNAVLETVGAKENCQ